MIKWGMWNYHVVDLGSLKRLHLISRDLVYPQTFVEMYIYGNSTADFYLLLYSGDIRILLDSVEYVTGAFAIANRYNHIFTALEKDLFIMNGGTADVRLTVVYRLGHQRSEKLE